MYIGHLPNSGARADAASSDINSKVKIFWNLYWATEGTVTVTSPTLPPTLLTVGALGPAAAVVDVAGNPVTFVLTEPASRSMNMDKGQAAPIQFDITLLPDSSTRLKVRATSMISDTVAISICDISFTAGINIAYLPPRDAMIYTYTDTTSTLGSGNSEVVVELTRITNTGNYPSVVDPEFNVISGTVSVVAIDGLSQSTSVLIEVYYDTATAYGGMNSETIEITTTANVYTPSLSEADRRNTMVYFSRHVTVHLPWRTPLLRLDYKTTSGVLRHNLFMLDNRVPLQR
ncbi:PREDICTED: uncharacterized protein LOC106815061 [Priapulus caudatus]|uniref:Uncharacterized protein LOC106815061 n=1 Tax=Priapulus caudatus TaxID=37621 RepID=A0ABM1ES03_PRICU|nr:PREDICTED: uncharacterized protein LOC106815061 [Priapulus caudatus]